MISPISEGRYRTLVRSPDRAGIEVDELHERRINDDMTMLHPVPACDSVAGSHEITRERQIMVRLAAPPLRRSGLRPPGIRLEHSWTLLLGILDTAVSQGNRWNDGTTWCIYQRLRFEHHPHFLRAIVRRTQFIPTQNARSLAH